VVLAPSAFGWGFLKVTTIREGSSVTNPRKAAMTKAGLGAAGVFAFVSILFFGTAVEHIPEFWERVAAVAVVGFLVGVVSFIFGQQYK